MHNEWPVTYQRNVIYVTSIRLVQTSEPQFL